MRFIERFSARGHPNILATHETTFEIIRGPQLSKRGDCIIAVGASKGLAQFSDRFRKACRNDDARVMVQIVACGLSEIIRGRGAVGLSLTHPEEMVGRKSAYVSDRTFMVEADKAASDLSRRLVNALKNSATEVKIVVTVEA